MLNYVAEEINQDWFHFLNILSNGSNIVKDMQVNGKSGTENINHFFESRSFQVKWNDLVQTLHAMEKGSMVKYIENNFLYTKGMISKELIFNDICNRYFNVFFNSFY